MDENNQQLAFRCCYCNKKIESTKVDPANVNVLINFDKAADQQVSQDFFCHTACFREKLHDAIRIHFHLHNILDD